MSLFDWLFGKKSQPAPKPPPPKVHEVSENSAQVLVEVGDSVVVMDREQYDYQYGESQAPDPAQRDLDELLPSVTRIRALACGMLGGKAMGAEVVLETTDTEVLTALRGALTIVEDPKTFSHCACLGGPTLELYRDQELVATIGLQHGRAIRWKRWKHDAQLGDGQALNVWLTDHGIERAFLDTLLNNQYDAGGTLPLGFQRRGTAPLSRAEQRVRLAELTRVRGGDPEAVLQHCQQVLDADPSVALAYVVRALAHGQRGDHERCAADCSEAIRLGLRDAEVFFIRAVAHDFSGKPHDALADCSATIAIDAKHAGAWNSRGLIRGRLGEVDEAMGDFSEAMRHAPKWYLPYFNRAQFHHGAGRLDVAIADYDQAIDLVKASAPPSETNQSDPTLALLHCRRGEAHYDQFREEQAQADFAEASRRNPAAAADAQGQMWLRRGQFDRALDRFTEMIRLRSQDGNGYLGRGMANESLGNLDQAVEDYTAAIRLHTFGNAHALRARVRQRQERYDDALADLSEHLRLHPVDVMAHMSRAFLHKGRGDKAAAFEDLNAAHRMAAQHPLVCNNLAWMLATCADARFRDGNRAVALARQACEATGWNDPFCLGTLGAACAETGAFAEAIRRQTQAIDLYPEEAKAAGRARLELYEAGQPCRE
jgi:tetratricopeptide (TPR) repeat protein